MFDRLRKKPEKQVPNEVKTGRIPWSIRSWQGSVISVIVTNGSPLTWKEIKEATSLEDKHLNRALFDLLGSGEICKIAGKHEARDKYQVSDKFYQAYSALYNPKTGLIKWIGQWKESRELDFSLEHAHFFLEGRHLDDFSKELVAHAKSEVLIVNPFIQDCDLSNTLMDARKHGIGVQIITRSPRDKNAEYLKNKQDYLSKLQKEGISIVYNEKAHAKLIVVDHAVAIVSSMNFYPDSSAGVSWEAGLVTTDTKVVDSTVRAIEKTKG